MVPSLIQIRSGPDRDTLLNLGCKQGRSMVFGLRINGGDIEVRVRILKYSGRVSCNPTDIELEVEVQSVVSGSDLAKNIGLVRGSGLTFAYWTHNNTGTAQQTR